jgi:hypothetical protein
MAIYTLSPVEHPLAIDQALTKIRQRESAQGCLWSNPSPQFPLCQCHLEPALEP